MLAPVISLVLTSGLQLALVDTTPQVPIDGMWKGQLVYRNAGKSDLTTWVRGASAYGVFRSPTTLIQVRKVGAKDWNNAYLSPTCGNSNPITPDEFMVLKPGHAVKMQAWFNWSKMVLSSQPEPGEYEVRVTLDTQAPIDKWIGGPIPEPAHSELKRAIQPLYDATPHGVFTTNAVRVVVH